MAACRDDRSSAVLLIGSGSPNTLDEVPAYLSLTMNDRLPDPRIVNEMVDRFRQIGGQSALLDIIQNIAAQVEEVNDLPVYVAMRYWHPFIKDIALQMLTDGIDHIIAIPLLPHYSILTVGQYRNALTNVVALGGDDIVVDFIEHWHDCDEFLMALAEAAAEKIQNRQPHIIFTARNLPAVILDHHDPYPQQAMNTTQSLVKRLGLFDTQWQFAYHSAMDRTIQWLSPTIEETLLEAAARGKREMLIVPISSVIDYIDTLYDIDIALMQLAQRHNIRLERIPALNDDSSMITILTHLIREHCAAN